MVVAALLFLFIDLVRFGDAEWPTMWQALGVDVRLGAILYAAAWVTTLWYLGLYELRVRWTIAGELSDIVVASFVLAFGTMSFLFLVRVVDVSRLFLLILIVAQPIVTIAGRIVLRLFFGWLRKRGYNRTFMVVVGVGDEAQAFADSVERHKDLGIEVIGHLRGPGGGDGVVTRPILGDGDDLGRIFREHIVDEVAICVPAGAADWIEPLIRLAADEGKHVRVPTVTPARTLDLQTEEMDGMVIRSYVHGPARMFSLLLKRIMDIVGAAVGLVILSPVLLAVAIAITLKEGRPVLFHQTRIGLHGRAFMLYKFRTMVEDAEDRFDEVVGHSRGGRKCATGNHRAAGRDWDAIRWARPRKRVVAGACDVLSGQAVDRLLRVIERDRPCSCMAAMSVHREHVMRRGVVDEAQVRTDRRS